MHCLQFVRQPPKGKLLQPGSLPRPKVSKTPIYQVDYTLIPSNTQNPHHPNALKSYAVEENESGGKGP